MHRELQESKSFKKLLARTMKMTSSQQNVTQSTEHSLCPQQNFLRKGDHTRGILCEKDHTRGILCKKVMTQRILCEKEITQEGFCVKSRSHRRDFM